MRLVVLPIALLLGACRSESTPIDQPVAEPAPAAVAPTVPEFAPIPVNQYDDYFGSFSGDAVGVEIERCTADLLAFEVAARHTKSYRRPRESGIAVRLALVRSGREVTTTVRTRWWSDEHLEGQPWEGEDDVATPSAVLSPTRDDLEVRFEVLGRWSGGERMVRGAVSIPREQVAPFLDAWNAARAAQER